MRQPNQRYRRLTISLPADLYEVVEGLAVFSKQSKSAVIVGFLDSVREPLKRTLSLLSAAHDAPDHVKRSLIATYDEFADELAAAEGVVETSFDVAEKRVSAGKRKAKKKAGKSKKKAGRR